MSILPSWQYSGLIEATNDLGLLEADLHAGRTEAAERGYLHGPQSIEVNDVMLLGDSRYVTATEAEQAGLDFYPWGTKYVMTWNAEGDGPEAQQT
jgi:hypothetical protein